MTPAIYVPNVLHHIPLEPFLVEVPWTRRTETRQEAFMALEETHYTYGSGNGVRTYVSTPFTPTVAFIFDFLRACLDEEWWPNVCFLNRYDDHRDHLGWHSDDSPGTEHSAPITVVSFGAAREIWWRKIGETGQVPADQRQVLEHGSVFGMMPDMQKTHQHRIPKGDRPMGPRISLTFRRFYPA
jgi:alkylated DNA repair dioxygenase AlkB